MNHRRLGLLPPVVRLTAVLGAVALAACVPQGSAPGAVSVAGGTVTIAGPEGFCVDRGATRSTADTGFVLLGSCAALSGSLAQPQPPVPAVLTASVIGDAPQDFASNLPQMASFFRSSAGAKALSRTGRAETVALGQVTSKGDALYIRASDSARANGLAVEPEYWRAIFAQNGRIITLSVMGLADRPVRAEDKRRLLDRFVQRVRAANAAPKG